MNAIKKISNFFPFQVLNITKSNTCKLIANLSSNHPATTQFTWLIQTPLSTGIWLNKLSSRLPLQYHHARFVCILQKLPKWLDVAMFFAGLVSCIIWHFLTMPGANVSKILLPEKKDLKLYVKLLQFVKLFLWGSWALSTDNAFWIDKLQISKNYQIWKFIEFFQWIPKNFKCKFDKFDF